MASHHHQQNPPFLVDALLCQEEDLCWDDDSTDTTCSIKCLAEIPEPFRQDSFDVLSDYDEELSFLLSKEQSIDFQKNSYPPCFAKARFEAVEWILKVIGYYSFSALTAVLAVNYLDRFLCGFPSHGDEPWMAQLAAVACLSLAAKVEETQVPLLLDLQVEGCAFVFESKTIQRMELLVLSTLEWKMNPVTPLSFLDHIASKKGHLCGEFLKRCHFLILSVIHDCRFMRYLPSALATATMLCVLSSSDPCGSVQYRDQLMGILGVEKDLVEGCYGLIQEVATSVEFHTSIKKRKLGCLPKSPRGFFDVSSFGLDSSNDSWALASVPSSPETLPKKIKPSGL